MKNMNSTTEGNETEAIENEAVDGNSSGEVSVIYTETRELQDDPAYIEVSSTQTLDKKKNTKTTWKAFFKAGTNLEEASKIHGETEVFKVYLEGLRLKANGAINKTFRAGVVGTELAEVVHNYTLDYVPPKIERKVSTEDMAKDLSNQGLIEIVVFQSRKEGISEAELRKRLRGFNLSKAEIDEAVAKQ